MIEHVGRAAGLAQLALACMAGARQASAAQVPRPRPPVAQADTPTSAVAHADRLQSAGRWTDAHDTLIAAMSRCGLERSGGPCRVLVSRALGDAHQRQARRDPAQRRILLERAVEWYRRTLNEESADPPALTNLALALRGLGNDVELERFLPEAITRDPSNVSLYALLLGDVYRDREAWAAALGAYQRAIAAAPEDEALRRRLVEAYRHIPDSAPRLLALVSRESDWATRFPDATARAYEVVVDALAPRDPAAAAAACLRWVSLLSEAQLLSKERLTVLARSWLTRYVDQLRAFLVDPRDPPTAGGRLWGTPEGREALARASLAAGRQRLAAGDPGAADAYWRAGLDAAGGVAPVALDLALEAAALYTRQPALDPTGTKFKMLEQSLITGKATAYQEADLEAVQRFHTVLGLIYTQRRTFGPPGYPWGAVYQLEHALSTARARDRTGRFYQPLPQLRAFLADAYAATNHPTAQATYLDAAAAYLDADALDEAQRALERAAPSAEAGGAARALDFLIRERRAAAAGVATRPPRAACEATAERGARIGRAVGRGEAFARRQRFKLLADCVLAGPAPVHPGDAAKVLTVAVEDSVPLVGARDLVRVQRSQAAVLRAVSAGPDGAGHTPGAAPGPGLQLLLPSETSPKTLPMNPDFLLGARVLAEVGADTGLRIRVREGQVTAAGTLSDTARATLQRRIQSVPGVRSVRVRAHISAMPPTREPSNPPSRPVTSGTAEKEAQAAFQEAVAGYARALETGNLEAVRRVVPEFDARALEALFQRAAGLRAQLRVGAFEVSGSQATVDIVGTLHYRYSRTGTDRSDDVQYQAVFIRDRGGWRMKSIT